MSANREGACTSVAEVAERLAGVPFTTPESGARLYDHIRTTRPQRVLELGSAHGVSGAYIAAALEANGAGHLTTVDHGRASYSPAPEETLDRVGLRHRVEIVRAHSVYTWWLKDQIAQHSDSAGNVDPVYDFVFLDGAHNFTVDGLAVVLVERLLRPGGWLLLDDLDWTYETNPWSAPALAPDGNPRPFGDLSDDERRAPQVRAVVDTVLVALPSFSQFRDDGWWLWAQKLPDAPRRYSLVTSRPLHALALQELRRRRWRRRAATSGGR